MHSWPGVDAACRHWSKNSFKISGPGQRHDMILDCWAADCRWCMWASLLHVLLAISSSCLCVFLRLAGSTLNVLLFQEAVDICIFMCRLLLAVLEPSNAVFDWKLELLHRYSGHLIPVEGCACYGRVHTRVLLQIMTAHVNSMHLTADGDHSSGCCAAEGTVDVEL